MEYLIVRFGAPRREMVGILSAPDSAPRGALWILCNPFGQEAVRSKPLYRMLAERLARAGCAVLRFDMHGTGDSPGELEDQSLAGWMDDILAADAWTRQRFAGSDLPMCWFGLRLGASLAALAAEKAARAPDRLLLWDPVFDGPRYIASLIEKHRDALKWMNWERLRRETDEPEPTLPGNILGYEVGPVLAAGLRALDGLPVERLLRRGVRIACALEPARLARSPLPMDPGLNRIAIDSPIDWMSAEALGTAIVPQEVLRTVLAAAQQ
jgi:pimeloyl-ACP methyl ester carboxylesterase